MAHAESHSEFFASTASQGPDLSDPALRQILVDTKLKLLEDSSTNPKQGLSRVALVAGGGIKDAGVHAANNLEDYLPEAAGGLGLGLGLGTLSKSGRYGPKATAAIGSLLAANWVYSEITGNRWTGFGDALVDAYKSPNNLANDRAIAQRSLGTFVVDTAVMTPAVATGFGLGMKVAPEGWVPKMGGRIKLETLELANSLGITGNTRLQPVAVERPALMTRRSSGLTSSDLIDGRTFMGGDIPRPANATTDATAIVKGKKTYDGLSALTDALVDQKIGRDRVAQGHKADMKALLDQNQQVQSQIQACDQQLKGLQKQKTEVETLPTETKALETAQQAVTSILESRQRITALEAELRTLEKAKGKDGAKPAEDGSPSRLDEVKRELKEIPNEEALTRARAKVHEAQQALETRKASQQEDLQRIEKDMQTTRDQREELNTTGQAIASELAEVVRDYKVREQGLRDGSLEVEPMPEPVKTPARAVRKEDTSSGGSPAGEPVAVVEKTAVEVTATEPVSSKVETPEAKGKPAEPVIEKPAAKVVEIAELPAPRADLGTQVLAKRVEVVLGEAERFSRAFENQRIQRQAEREIADIGAGRKTFTEAGAKEAALEQAQVRKAAADLALKDNPPKYAQTLKKLHDYTRAVEAYYKAEPNPAARNQFLRDAVATMEELMQPIDNIWNGIPDKTPDLPRPGSRSYGERPMWPEERLPQIQKHLEAKINTVDGAQAQRIGVVKDNVAFKEILRLHEEGALPQDGSLVFFTRDGVLLYQSELKVSQRSTMSRARDAESAQRHANNTPAFIDVARLDKGLGPEGAGLWRFIGNEGNITGAAVLKPVLRDGKPVELPGARNGRGEPMIKKEVALALGQVPPEIQVGMPYGHLLNTLRAKRTAMEKAAGSGDAAPSRPTTGPLSTAVFEGDR